MPRVVVNVDVGDLVARYAAGESVKELSDSLGVSRRALTKRLMTAGVEIRGRAEAERLKWSRMTNPARRKAQVAAAQTARRGMRDSFEVKCRRAQSWFRLQHHIWPAERSLATRLAARNVAHLQQFPVGPYNLDFALDGRRVAVEIEIGNALKPALAPNYLQRLKYIFDADWRVLFVYTKNVRLAPDAVADQCVAWLEAAGRDEPGIGHYGVVDGEGKPTTYGRLDLDDFARVPGF